MKKIRLIIVTGMILLLIVSVIGCGKKEQKQANLSGDVTISGSTSVEKVGVGIAEEFMALNPDAQVTYEAIGSSAGIKNAQNGVTQIGTASRNLKDKEKEWGMTEKVIAYDGIAVVVHPSNPVSNLTKEQVQKIYTGEIKNWKDVGGKDENIVVVSREDGSGTRGAFEEIVGFEGNLIKDAIIAEGNGNVQSSVAGNPQSIGYVSFTYINDTIKPVNIGNVKPTTENVLAEKYPISRPFLMVYHEKNLNDTAKAFIDFIYTKEGQDIVKKKGAIPVGSEK